MNSNTSDDRYLRRGAARRDGAASDAERRAREREERRARREARGENGARDQRVYRERAARDRRGGRDARNARDASYVQDSREVRARRDRRRGAALDREPEKPLVQTFRRSQPRGAGLADWLQSHMVLLLVVAAVVVTLAALYRPVQTYYLAWRQSIDLQAEYDYVSAQNDGLKGDIGRLQTRQGIEDEARSRGYGYEGESTTGSAAAGGAEGGSSAGTEEFSILDVERPWYVHVLDYIFGYQP